MSARITTICGNCECEWDADLKAPDSECPECGYVDGEMGENVMRDDSPAADKGKD